MGKFKMRAGEKLYLFTVSKKIEQAVFSRLLTLVCEERREGLLNRRLDIDKKLSLYAELIVRTAACRGLGLKNKDLVFEKETYGKPRLKGAEDFYYSVAHSSRAAAVALSGAPVGVDIERIGKGNSEVAKRFFTASEQEYFKGEPAFKDRRFYEIWTKKEAYIKWTGRGLSSQLSGIDTCGGEISGMFATFEREGYILSVCGGGDEVPRKVKKLTEKEVVCMALSLF